MVVYVCVCEVRVVTVPVVTGVAALVVVIGMVVNSAAAFSAVVAASSVVDMNVSSVVIIIGFRNESSKRSHKTPTYPSGQTHSHSLRTSSSSRSPDPSKIESVSWTVFWQTPPFSQRTL